VGSAAGWGAGAWAPSGGRLQVETRVVLGGDAPHPVASTVPREALTAGVAWCGAARDAYDDDSRSEGDFVEVLPLGGAPFKGGHGEEFAVGLDGAVELADAVE
jgi:hypothetical protein